MKISKRLERIATYVSGYNSLADIACDHGLLGIYCKLNYNTQDILLSDINPEPLESAKINLIKYNTPDINVKLGDGFKALDKAYECITICGIGGFLMRDIITDGMDYAKKAKRLVLCPNSDSYEVRKLLMENGFVIDREEMVYDYKYYEIIVCHYEGNIHTLSELELKYGPLLLKEKSNEFKAFYNHLLELTNKNLNNVKDLSRKALLNEKKLELEHILK